MAELEVELGLEPSLSFTLIPYGVSSYLQKQKANALGNGSGPVGIPDL